MDQPLPAVGVCALSSLTSLSNPAIAGCEVTITDSWEFEPCGMFEDAVTFSAIFEIWTGRARKKELLRILSEIPDCCNAASDEFRQAVGKLIKLVKKNDIAWGKAESGEIFGRKSIFGLFADVFDPLLEQHCPPNSKLQKALENYSVNLPIKPTLASESACKRIADNISDAITNFEPVGERENESGENTNYIGTDYAVDADTVEAIIFLLRRILSFTSNARIAWCKACFRRAPTSSQYCDEHRPKNQRKPDKHTTSFNTSHKKGNRVYERMPIQLQNARAHRQSRREALDEHPVLLACEDDVPNTISAFFKGVIVEPLIKELSTMTTMNWSAAGNIWDEIIKANCPAVHKIFKQKATEYASWHDYCAALLGALKNMREQTRNPYWILMMLVDAEDWLVSESSFSDTRRKSRD